MGMWSCNPVGVFIIWYTTGTCGICEPGLDFIVGGADGEEGHLVVQSLDMVHLVFRDPRLETLSAQNYLGARRHYPDGGTEDKCSLNSSPSWAPVGYTL